ncbi:MAG: hypothetical protein ACI4DV_00640 [Lachnospiraceae bacterium]
MFFQTLLTSLFKAALLALVAFGGVKAGKKLRDHKNAKADEEA